MRIQAIYVILNIYIIFLTNTSYSYFLDYDFNCGAKHITNQYFTGRFNVSVINELLMRSCEITEVDENAFDSMVELKYLDLSHNDINRLPANIFSSLTSLTKLRIKNNKIQYLDPNLFKNLNELSLLDLHNNNINKIDKNLFTNTKKLRTLYLYSNKLTVLEPGTFDNNLQLHYIDLYDNHLTELKNGLFSKLMKLEKLYITYNWIKNIETQALPTSLIELFLSNNNLEYLDPKVITNLKKLKYLTFFGNPWNCDMKLKELVKACQNLDLRAHHWYTIPVCVKPERLANKDWNALLDEIECGVNEEFGCDNPCSRHCHQPRFCQDSCDRKCICKAGFRRDAATGRCIDENYCPQTSGQGDTHEVFSECNANCQSFCFNDRPICAGTPCVAGYTCPGIYVRDTVTGRCVRPADCYRLP